MQELIPEILREISEKDKGDSVMFGKNYSFVKIKEESFFEIKNPNETTNKKRKLAFIDGGNQEIMGGANFSLQLLRVYYCIYENNIRIYKGGRELFVLIRANNKNKNDNNNNNNDDKNKNNNNNNNNNDEDNNNNNNNNDDDKNCKMVYSVTSFESCEKSKNNSFGDFELYENNHKVSPGKIACDVRKLIELNMINEIIELSDHGDIIVRDGDLCAQNEYEKKELNEIYKFANTRGVIICGISKTNELITNTGESAVVMIKEKKTEKNICKDQGIWYCSPIVQSKTNLHQAEIAFVKLHKLSEYIFRFDIYNLQKEKTNLVLWELSKNSCDPIFLGYPYGLIDADKFARVTNSEIEYYKMQLFVKGENKIKNYLKGIDAHSVLDTIG